MTTLAKARIVNYNHICSFIVLATVITIINYDRHLFIVQATDDVKPFLQDTIRRCKDLDHKGILYVGSGVSGGEEGARHGPSLMPGGNPNAWC